MEDWTGAIALGCGGTADLPVTDSVSAAVKLAEALIGMGLGTSKIGDFAFHLPNMSRIQNI